MRNTESHEISESGYASNACVGHTFTQRCRRLPTSKGNHARPHGAYGNHGKQSAILKQSFFAVCGEGRACRATGFFFQIWNLHSFQRVVETSESFSLQKPKMM